MSPIDYSYRVLDEKKKQVEIKYHNRTLRFELKQKRAFVVLKQLLKKYPDYFPLHDLDKTYSDPNKAHSELKLIDGFGEFISERKAIKNVITAKIDIDKLFDRFSNKLDSQEFIKLTVGNLREILNDEIKAKIFNDFKGTCNITKIKLEQKLPKNYFYKRALEATYDHRRPLSKGGKDNLANIQLTSVLANSEKNKICNGCSVNICEKCALAYPEKYNIIQGNAQNIELFKKKAVF